MSLMFVRRAALSLGLLAAACLAAGCGDEEAVADLCGENEEAGASRAEYPGGPFGTKECERLEDLGFVGPQGEAVTLSSLRADPDKKLLLLTTSAGWCTACIDEQPQLEALQAQYGPQGLTVLVTLFEDQDFNAIDEGYAEEWIRRFDLSLNVVADPEKKTHAYYDPSATPMLMLVDLASMKILKILIGSQLDTVESLVQAKLGG